MTLTSTVDSIIGKVNTATSHIASSSNPHSVTKAQVGLSNVDNTSDANKPVSSATQTALNLKANQSTTYTKIEVDSAISGLVDSAPLTLNTLNELAAALGDDANFATTVTNNIATKAPLNSPTFTGTVSGVTKTMVGLGSVDNTADTAKNVLSATKLTTARTITLAGDVGGSASFDGSANISITAVILDDSHNHTISNVDGLQDALDSKIDDSQVLTNVPIGAVFTDTTYIVGDGQLTEKNFTSVLNTKLAGIETGATTDQTAAEILASLKTVDVNGTAGVNAGTCDGLAITPAATRNNAVNKVVTTQANGYCEFGWINTTSGATTAATTDYYVNTNDGYIRKKTAALVKSDLGLTGTNSGDNPGVTSVATSGAITGGTITGTGTISHSTAAGNKHIPTGGTVGQILKNTASGTATWQADNNTTYTAGANLSLTGTTFANTAPNIVQTTVSGSSGSCTGNAATATALATARSITLTGDVTGTATYNGTATTTITATVANNSHTHTPANAALGNLSSNGNALSGSFTATGNITAYSDLRLKSNIEVIDDALAKVMSLRGVNFDMNGERSTGVIAQELELVLPEAVRDNEDGMKSIAYGNIVGLLIEAIKELSAKVEKLENK